MSDGMTTYKKPFKPYSRVPHASSEMYVKFHVSRTQVDGHVDELQRGGYTIEDYVFIVSKHQPGWVARNIFRCMTYEQKTDRAINHMKRTMAVVLNTEYPKITKIEA
jgi:hypothetical protein